MSQAKRIKSLSQLLDVLTTTFLRHLSHGATVNCSRCFIGIHTLGIPTCVKFSTESPKFAWNFLFRKSKKRPSFQVTEKIRKVEYHGLSPLFCRNLLKIV